MRIMIVNDEHGGWYIRHIYSVEHDLDRDEKVYRCDRPIGDRFDSLDDAAVAARAALALRSLSSRG